MGDPQGCCCVRAHSQGRGCDPGVGREQDDLVAHVESTHWTHVQRMHNMKRTGCHVTIYHVHCY